MDEAELSELLTAPGFFRFLAEQAKLDVEDIKRIYLLGRPWGLWPPDLDISHEAAETGVDVFTYLAALQPLLDMDAEEKEAQLAAYEATLTGGESTLLSPAVRVQVEKVAALSREDEATICRILHALYAYRQRVGRLSIQKVGESSKHRMEQDQAAAIAKLQRALAAELEQRKNLP
ncbi:MAG: hypothetical protein EPO02_03270 [Nitrospirae bacterium]|nr:MAG: hypothetical protein EPO02_03270 [Nitrospirota bacterium]